MSKSDAELEGWRGALSEALGTHGRLVVELVPELKLIIGEQPPAPDLPPQQTRRLFQIAFRRFVGAFAKPEHPLALFLDDLHWVDAATLDLLEDLMTDSDLRHLLVIAAYRDNEIDPTHPLVRKLEAIRAAGAKVGQITLTPLGREHLEELVAGCAALRTGCGPLRSRSSSMRRPAAIRSSRSDFCPRSPTKAWSRSIRLRPTGPGISIASAHSDTRRTSSS